MTDVVLVTGGAGFVGSHVVDALLARGHRVRELDWLHPAAHAGEPRWLDERAEHVRGDLRDAEVAARCLDGVTAVCHQAAMVGLGTGISDIADYVSHNDLATATLLRALAARRFAGPLVLASSMVVYGEGAYRCTRHGAVAPGPRQRVDLDAGRFDPPCPGCGEPLAAEPVTERSPPDPRNVYAATKLAQEHLCAAYARECSVPLAVLRYHNVYGPRMPRETPYAGVASNFLSALRKGEAPRVFEDGCQRRDFVHVRDIARANVLAIEAGATGTFNVASGIARTIGAMAGALARTASEHGPAPVVTGEYRLGDVRHVFAAVDRAADQLGFRAREPFEAGMAELARAELREPPRS